jgi:hypothetical protein
MTHTDERWQDLLDDWQHLGRAAEHFARRVARDARRFAERIEEHAGEFAGEVRREWRRAGRGIPGSADDVRRVFDDVRGVLSAVLEGVDELITDVFSGGGPDPWTRIVMNRDATCAGCARPIAAGAEAYVRRRGSGRELRCVECGAPKDATA